MNEKKVLTILLLIAILVILICKTMISTFVNNYPVTPKNEEELLMDLHRCPKLSMFDKLSYKLANGLPVFN